MKHLHSINLHEIIIFLRRTAELGTRHLTWKVRLNAGKIRSHSEKQVPFPLNTADLMTVNFTQTILKTSNLIRTFVIQRVTSSIFSWNSYYIQTGLFIPVAITTKSYNEPQPLTSPNRTL
jgi:hypothetical protein